jgi:hypothetical protein
MLSLGPISSPADSSSLAWACQLIYCEAGEVLLHIVHLYFTLYSCTWHCTSVLHIVHLYFTLYICTWHCTVVLDIVHLYFILCICTSHCTFVLHIVHLYLHLYFTLYICTSHCTVVLHVVHLYLHLYSHCRIVDKTNGKQIGGVVILFLCITEARYSSPTHDQRSFG